MAHAFLSYVRQDSAVVDEVAAFLRSRGVLVWLDRDDIEPGRFWKDAIAQAIESGAHFLAFFSHTSLARDRTHMNEELSLALDELRQRGHDTGWFVPILLEDGVLPPPLPFRPKQTLRDFQGVHWFGDKENAKRGLLKALGIRNLREAEEKQLVLLLHSQFPSQRDHARKSLCKFRALSPETVELLIRGIFEEDSARRQIAAADVLFKASSKSIDKLAMAILLTGHKQRSVRLSAYKLVYANADDSELQKLAPVAARDSYDEIRAIGYSFLSREFKSSPDALKTILKMLNDKSSVVRNCAVRRLFDDKKSSIWGIFPHRYRPVLAAAMVECRQNLADFAMYFLLHPTDMTDFEDVMAMMEGSFDSLLSTRVSLIRRRTTSPELQLYRTFPVFERSTVVRNIRGFDARPCAKLVTLCSRFEAEISLWNEDSADIRVLSDSIMGLMMLGISKGDGVGVSAFGPQAEEALDAVIEFIDSGMDDAM